jgi:hypothetical protein
MERRLIEHNLPPADISTGCLSSAASARESPSVPRANEERRENA